ncbi:MAG TPA: hypothetical protein VG095_09550 [Chthoniobacterales bacterium]|nr:hypothetical protein [Chthoniobacterales bacterium]
MHSAARLCLLGILLLTGCTTVRRAAVTTFRVIDTPRRYVREQIEGPEGVTTTTTTTTAPDAPPVSDVVTPGRPVTPTAPAPAPPRVAATPRPRTQATGTPRPPTTTASPRPPPAPAAAEHPVARPVPGRPGYVYSLDPNGGIVDVTGYKSGDRAKDPYTKRIFIVP